MRRHLPRLAAAVTLAFIPAVLGTATAVLYTNAGNETLARLASQELSRVFRGHFEMQRVSGSFLRTIVLEQLVIRDSAGQPFATVPRLSARYALPNLLAGRFVFSSVELDQPDVRIIKRRNGRLNYQEVFRLGEGPEGTGRPPLVELRNIRLRQAHIQLRLPWNPPDTASTAAMVAAALAEDRARPGRVVLATPDGLRRVVELEALNARLPVLRISSPDDAPLTLDLDSLSTRVSDPAVQIVDLAAHAWTRGDSLAFTAHRAALPGSRFTGGGVITWPRGPVLYDFSLDAPRIDLRDFHWISPDFPDFTGHAVITARSHSDILAAFTMRELELEGPKGRITGSLTALVDEHRGVGVENMSVELTDVDLDVPRPYVDSMPLYGTLTGHLGGSGFRDGLDLDADLAFHDAVIEGGATTTLRGAGHLVLGGPYGPLFDTVVVNSGDLDLRTVHRISPSMQLRGRLEMAGVLRGPWHNLTFEGDLAHHDGDGPLTHATGTATLDTRGEALRFQTRMQFAPLAFDGVRPSYPGIPMQGTVSGLVSADGTVERFHLTTDVQGDLGALALSGTIEQHPTAIQAESLTATFSRLDLALLRGTGPHTALLGRLEADGVLDTLTGPEGTLWLDLGRGRVAEFPVDTLHAWLRGEGSRIELDTVVLISPAGRLTGGGSLAWRDREDRRMHAEFRADSLEPLDDLLTRFTGPPIDSAAADDPLHGHLLGEIDLLGSVRAPRLVGWARGEGMRWRGIRAPELALGFGWNDATRPEIGLSVRSDSMFVGSWLLKDLGATLGGYQDSLRWVASVGLGDMASAAGGGGWWRQEGRPIIGVDSLVTVLPRHVWRLREPGTIAVDDGHLTLSPLTLEAGDGSGALRLTGTVPRGGVGSLGVDLFGVDLRDVYTLLEMDTTGIAGTIQLDLAVGGTSERPILQGTGSVADLSFGDFGSPFVQGVFNYADRGLDLNLLMWKTGQPVLRAEATLPVDLALKSLPRRQVDGPIAVRVVADSTDLSVAEAFTRNLRRVRGTLRADVRVSGTWNEPRLDGQVAVIDASTNVPGLGVRYERLNAFAHLSADSIRIDSLFVRSGDGSLRANGAIRLEQLTRPVLGINIRASRFRTLDVKRFLTLDASGSLRLTGPVWHARLTGQMTADAGNLHFADLVTKRIVDLENPGDSGLIDLDLIRTARLGANFQSRFLDSLTIDTLQITMGESFWLRSSEANIQLDGELTVNKVRSRYRYDGTLNAVRGNYTLRIGGLVSRDFTVARGTARYFGTPDLNADLDIEANYTVIAAETNEEIPILAHITGTMLQPKLELSSPPTTSRPALSQTEVVSYLMFGRPTFSLSQGTGTQNSQYSAVQAGVSYLTSAFSSELQRTLISDLGVPIDYLDIRTGSPTTGGTGSQSGSAQVAQVAAGWQIGRKWFVSLLADLCTNTQRLYPSAEFRMTRQLRLKTSVEPAYTCQAHQIDPTLSTSKYQVGLDVLWDREY
ncbi:MAG TPA: translocation/assembly module TamB domain-containing protein [Gemmatimonadales bacterium]|nr:translocation/assembly module TamB domain-containing protein [Gemmatimonadales bacterium]